MNRGGLILAALAAGGENAPFTPVQAQKLLFLIDREIPKLVGGPHFNFQPYDFGPFDRTVYDVLDMLTDQGLVNQSAARYRIYTLSPKGYREGTQLLLSNPAAAPYIRQKVGTWPVLQPACCRDLSLLSGNEGQKHLPLMTVAVAFLCTDGVVIAADSMLTPSIGGTAVGHHKGVKVEVISGPQVFAFAGDHGLSARFKIIADIHHSRLALGSGSHPIDYPISLAEEVIRQFARTGIDPGTADISTILAFVHSAAPQCCVFEGPTQPRLLDTFHFYVAHRGCRRANVSIR